MFFIYVLRSENYNRFYVGMTSNIKRRLCEHNKGKTKSTKGYLPWKLFFFEEYPTRASARKREICLKTGEGRAWIKRKWLLSSTG